MSVDLWPSLMHRLKEVLNTNNSETGDFDLEEHQRRADLFRNWLYGEDDHE